MEYQLSLIVLTLYCHEFVAVAEDIEIVVQLLTVREKAEHVSRDFEELVEMYAGASFFNASSFDVTE